jgi:multisubunit Na+/H+ antiporter MnhB subunit
MAVTLGFGDAFHLIPRIIALWTTGFESHAASLGFGKFVTSITMTIFYLILYKLWKMRFKIKQSQKLDFIMWGLATIRIALCFFPQNQWFTYNAPVTWGIYRNIPFAIMGIIMIILFYMKGKSTNDKNAIKISIAVILSFGFYVPVVLWAQVNMLIGMLMIPKTIAYLWIVFIGFGEFRNWKKQLANK